MKRFMHESFHSCIFFSLWEINGLSTGKTLKQITPKPPNTISQTTQNGTPNPPPIHPKQKRYLDTQNIEKAEHQLQQFSEIHQQTSKSDPKTIPKEAPNREKTRPSSKTNIILKKNSEGPTMITSFSWNVPPKGVKRLQKPYFFSKIVVTISLVLDGLPNLILETNWLKIMLKIDENRQGNA